MITSALKVVGARRFELPTPRPPDDYYKSHYNRDNQYDAYMPFSLGLIHGLTRINQDGLTYYHQHKINNNQINHQDYHRRIYNLTITYFYDSIYHIF